MTDQLETYIEPGLEARLVAMVLGEASAFETEELERLIEERAELKLFRDRMQVMHGMLRETGEGELETDEDWTLPVDKREALLQVFDGNKEVFDEPASAPEKRRAKKVYLIGGALAASLTVCAGVFYSMSTTANRAALSYRIARAEPSHAFESEEAQAKPAVEDLRRDIETPLKVLADTIGSGSSVDETFEWYVQKEAETAEFESGSTFGNTNIPGTATVLSGKKKALHKQVGFSDSGRVFAPKVSTGEGTVSPATGSEVIDDDLEVNMDGSVAIVNSGRIEAKNSNGRGGEIDIENGVIDVSGSVDASSVSSDTALTAAGGGVRIGGGLQGNTRTKDRVTRNPITVNRSGGVIDWTNNGDDFGAIAGGSVVVDSQTGATSKGRIEMGQVGGSDRRFAQLEHGGRTTPRVFAGGGTVSGPVGRYNAPVGQTPVTSELGDESEKLASIDNAQRELNEALLPEGNVQPTENLKSALSVLSNTLKTTENAGEERDKNLAAALELKKTELRRLGRKRQQVTKEANTKSAQKLINGPKPLTHEKSASTEPFSTFSLHVSDVSFKLAHAAITKGEWPDPARIRIEEFVNAFDYEDPIPSQQERVTSTVEQAIHPTMQQRNMLRIAMRTAEAGRSASTPLNLTFLLDTSGSMERFDRQQTLLTAFSLLAKQLNAGDKVSLISFARQPRLVAEAVAGNKSAELVSLVAQLPEEGGTNLEAALNLAFEKAKEHISANSQNRIILLTDGAANLGDANPERLSGSVEKMRDAGIAFDAAGIGADGLNDEILEALTRKGDGRYYLLDRPEDANAQFAKQIAGALRPAAMNVKVQIEFNPERVGRYHLYGFEKHRLKKEDFRNDSIDAAEMAAAEAGVALYHFEPLPEGQGDVGSVSVRFKDMATGRMVEKRWPIPYQPSLPRLDDSSETIRLAAIATLVASKLKGEAPGELTEWNEIAESIGKLSPNTKKRERVVQLREMVEKAGSIK